MKYQDARTAVRFPMHARSLPLRAGTRGSLLARVQTSSFLKLLADACPALRHDGVFRECIIGVTGDAIQDRSLADIGGKGLFAKEIHEELLAGRIDLAVHSLKDLDTELPDGIVIACMLKREDARDCLLLGPALADRATQDHFAALPHAALVGTCSVRRQAQLLHARPDLRITGIRGNVQSRLGKLAAGQCDATLLARAGLNRLDLADHASITFDCEEMLPAAGQGIIAVTVREDDIDLLELLDAMADPYAKAACRAERAMLAVLDGSCRTPIGAHAAPLGAGGLRLTGMVARPDGSFLVKRSIEGAAADATRIGAELGLWLRAECPADLLAELFDATMRTVHGARGAEHPAVSDPTSRPVRAVLA
jgi:hydroxymethylbilane synthase